MNKLLTKIVGLTLGLSMAIGVGVAVGVGSKEAISVNADTSTDTLTRSLIGITGTSYTAWSGKKSNSNAVYAGNSAGKATVDNVTVESIQLRSNNNTSGIITTASGGKAKSVTISWHSSTSSGRTINVYGKNSAYSSAADLYGSSSGTLIGTIVYGTSTSLSISDDYEYIGLRSNSGAQYLTQIDIVWDVPSETCTVSFDTDDGSSVASQTIAKGGKATAPTSDPVKSGFDFDGWYTTSGYTTPFDFENTSINSDTTIYAKWVTASSYYKIEEELSDWSGEYVLGYEHDSSTIYVWDGTDNASCYSSQTVTDGKIKRDNGGATLSIATMTGGYSIKVSSGSNKNKYVGGLTTDSNGIQYSDSEILNEIAYESSLSITSNSKHFTFNSANDQLRFRYFKTANSAISLYKKYVAYTVTYLANGGSGTMPTSESVVSACSFTAPTNQEFDHWNTADDDSGVSYNAGDHVSANATLYAIWRNLQPRVTLSASALSVDINGSSDSLTVTPTNIDNPSYSWVRSDGEDCVTMSDSTSAGVNTLTVSAKGSTVSGCTLTVTVNGTLLGNPITPIVESVSIMVNRESTEANPFTIAEAKLSIDRGVHLSDAYVGGKVSRVEEFISKYSSITYDISADGSTGNELQVYSGKGLSSADFKSASDVVAGATVVIKGNLQLHNETYQFNYNNYLISYVAPAETYSVTYSAPDADSGTVPTDANVYAEGSTVTVLGNTGSLERDGYSFNGWSDGSTTYQTGNTFSMGTANVTLTAVWKQVLSVKDNYYKLSSGDIVTNGKYIIGVDTGSVYGMTRSVASNKYAFSSALTVNDGVIENYNDSLMFEITTVTGGFTIYNLSTGKYVKYVSSTNLSEADDAYVWTIGAGVHGSFRITSGTEGRLLAARAGSSNVFGGYSSGNVTASSTEYYDVELFRAFTADDLASDISTKITCTVDGSVAPAFATGYSWSTFTDEFNDQLTSYEQAILTEATYTKTGTGSSTVITPTGDTTQLIADAVAKYDYIVSKYGTSSYSDFMDRSPSGDVNPNAFININNTDNVITIIAIISVISVSAIGGFFFLRKRKEQ